MNKAHQGIYKIADKLWLEGIKFKITYEPDESPAIKIESEFYYEVVTTADGLLSVQRLGRIIIETDTTEFAYQTLIWNLNKERREQREGDE